MCRILLFLTAFIFVAYPFTSICSAEQPPSALNLKTERAIIFKDGYALIIKRATGTTDENGELFTEDVPDSAVLGSFWAVPEQGRMISMVAGWKTTKVSAEK